MFHFVFEDSALQPLAWLTLTPFFYSLHCARDSGIARFLQGISFFGLAGLFYYRDVAHVLVPALQAGLFAIAAGPLLRSQQVTARAFGLPILWAGLEVFRGLLSPLGIASAPGWLTIGAAVTPGGPTSQVAAIIGLYGLSFALALSASFFACVLARTSWPQQFGWAGLGLAVPLACQALGTPLLLPSPTMGNTGVVRVAAATSGSVQRLQQLTRNTESLQDGLLVWPRIQQPLTPDPDGPTAASQAQVEAAISLEAWTLGVVPADKGSSSATETVLADPRGRLQTKSENRREPVLFEISSRTVLVASGDDLATPTLAREGVAAGATAVVGIDGESQAWTEGAVRHRAVLSRYRAIENRRWLAYAGWRIALVIDPHGAEAVAIKGFEGAGDARIEWIPGPSFYSVRGWWIELLLLLGAGWLVLWALMQPHGKRANSRIPRDRGQNSEN